MWKLKNLIVILMIIDSSHSATLYCEFSSNPLACTTFSLSFVMQVNEEIIVSNPPFVPYVDNITTDLGLTVSSGTVRQFPRRLFDIFVNSRRADFGGIISTELGTDSFYNCENLLEIRVINSKIPHIGAKFASSCSAVQTVSLITCEIETIEENAFEGLTNLNVLSIVYNSKLICIPSQIFQYTRGLTTINLNFNGIKALHSKFFSNLQKLHKVFLQYNQVEYLPNFDLMSTGSLAPQRLWVLDLFPNPIIAIHPQLITSFYTSGRMANGDLLISLGQSGTTNCFSGALSVFNQYFQETSVTIGIIQDWALLSALLGNSTTCYAAFTSEMASDSVVTCGGSLSTSSTNSASSSYSGVSSTTRTFTSSSPSVGGFDYVPTGNGNNGGQTSNLPSSYFGSEGTRSTITPIIFPSSTFATTAGSGSGGQCATDKICRYYLDWNDQYTCVIDGAEGTVTSITGTHYLTYSDLHVVRVYFKNSFLSFVPKIIFQKFPNLKFLHTANSGMTVISDHTFTECGVLELWDASDNEITRFDETSLRNCTNLKIIDLTGNPVDYVSQGLFELDPALQRIHLKKLNEWTLE